MGVDYKYAKFKSLVIKILVSELKYNLKTDILDNKEIVYSVIDVCYNLRNAKLRTAKQYKYQSDKLVSLIENKCSNSGVKK